MQWRSGVRRALLLAVSQPWLRALSVQQQCCDVGLILLGPPQL